MVTPTGYTRSGEMSTPYGSVRSLARESFVPPYYRVMGPVLNLSGP